MSLLTQESRAFLELGQLTKQTLDFSSAEVVSDSETLTAIKKALQIGRGRKITALVNVTVDEDGTFKGEFQQYINPQLTKRFRFTFGENELSFTPINGKQIEKFSEDIEEFALSKSKRAGKALNCKIEQCGGRCLRLDESCRLTSTPQQKEIWKSASGKNLANKIDTSLAKKRRETKAKRRTATEQANATLSKAEGNVKTASDFFSSGKPLTASAAKDLGMKPGETVSYPSLKAQQEKRDKAKTDLEKLTGKKSRSAPVTTKRQPMSALEVKKPLSADEKKALNAAFNADFSRSSEGSRQLMVSDAQATNARTRATAAGLDTKDISTSELKALVSYTSSGYVGMNAALRGQQLDPTSALATKQRLAARAANQALEKLPVYKGEVRRDTQLNKTDFDRDYQPGNILQFKGLTSTSRDTEGSNSKSYADNASLSKASFYQERATSAGVAAPPPISDRVKVEYRIQSRSGRDISAVSDRPFEQEVLLPHNFKGRVTRVEDDNGTKRVFMEEED